ncbi:MULTISPECIES: hypothetical protein [unclassified Sphingobacterium]|uniref:hypothetical protein n=1 Tax=unclassified Sphingobacterium TaxID=2609468 RepID=UPI0025DA6DDE|nr:MULTISPECIES: hypothetical protein [unclassified Sphingobacterium]
MRGISDLKHRKLLAISLEIQGDLKQVVDSEVLYKLRREFTNLNELSSFSQVSQKWADWS